MPARIDDGPSGITRSAKLPADGQPIGQIPKRQRRGDGPIAPRGGGGRWRVLFGQRAKPELVEDLERALPRSAAIGQRRGVEVDRHVGPDARQVLALARVVGVPEQPLAIPLVLDLGGVRQQVLERAVGRDQLARALVADARNALDVVDRVAHQREHVDDLLGSDAELLLHARRVEPGALVAGVEDADAVPDELKEILVHRHDRDRKAGGERLFRQRPDHIVGFVASRR